MIKKVFFVSLVLSALSFSVCFAQTLEEQKALIYSHIDAQQWSEADAAVDKLRADFPAEPNLPESLCMIGSRFSTHAQDERAKAIYQTILTEYPEDLMAGVAQYRLVCLAILTKTEPEAQAEYNKLMADFSTHAKLPEMLCAIADMYGKRQDCGRAEQLYQLVVSDYPKSEYAGLAYYRVVLLSLLTGNDTKAQNALDILIVKFSDHPRFAVMLYETADRYVKYRQNYDKAEQLFQIVLNDYSFSKYAALAQRQLVNIAVLRGDYGAAEDAADILSTNFSSDSRLAEMLYDIASKYVRTGRYAQAKDIYSQIAEQHPASSLAGVSELNVRRMDIMPLIDSGDDTAADVAINQMIADFNNHPDLAFAISRGVAERYYLKAFESEKAGLANQTRGQFQRAAVIWERVINELGGPSEMPHACCWAGDCYRRLGQYQKSIDCYKKAADDYPGHRLAWHALFLVGRNYESLKKTGAMSESEADPKIKAAYQQLLEDYPDSKAARHAQYWLSRNN